MTQEEQREFVEAAGSAAKAMINDSVAAIVAYRTNGGDVVREEGEAPNIGSSVIVDLIASLLTVCALHDESIPLVAATALEKALAAVEGIDGLCDHIMDLANDDEDRARDMITAIIG